MKIKQLIWLLFLLVITSSTGKVEARQCNGQCPVHCPKKCNGRCPKHCPKKRRVTPPKKCDDCVTHAELAKMRDSIYEVLAYHQEEIDTLKNQVVVIFRNFDNLGGIVNDLGVLFKKNPQLTQNLSVLSDEEMIEFYRARNKADLKLKKAQTHLCRVQQVTSVLGVITQGIVCGVVGDVFHIFGRAPEGASQNYAYNDKNIYGGHPSSIAHENHSNIVRTATQATGSNGGGHTGSTQNGGGNTPYPNPTGSGIYGGGHGDPELRTFATQR